MAVTANFSRGIRRIRQVRDAVANLAPYKLVDIANDAIGAVSQQALSDLAGRDDQVGFDLAQFIRNISQAGALQIIGEGRASIGILDQIRMGTLEDFEEISQGGNSGLWHEHTGAAQQFKAQVFDYPDLQSALAHERQIIWGRTTPQWYLLEHGYPGDDAYPPVPASRFIENATRSDKMALLMRNAMSQALSGIPRT